FATVDGDIEKGSFMAGQSAAMVKEITPCKEIIEAMVNQAREIMPAIEL
ncbi:TPA: enoyl-[acyl-carrier-protein] reductase FabK, partial [Clostridioides difficile]|nr:enoyl-[acyl-carrier-protein] reductase FabK [Clostridioides difficile]